MAVGLPKIDGTNAIVLDTYLCPTSTISASPNYFQYHGSMTFISPEEQNYMSVDLNVISTN